MASRNLFDIHFCKTAYDTWVERSTYVVAYSYEACTSLLKNIVFIVLIVVGDSPDPQIIGNNNRQGQRTIL